MTMHRYTASVLRAIVAVPALCAFATISGCVAAPGDESLDDESIEGEDVGSSEGALETYASEVNLIAQHSGKCLSVQGASQADGANIRQWTCDDDDRREFALKSTGDGYYQLVAKHSGKCMAVSGSGTADGTDINQWTCGESDNQKFKPIPSENGHFSLLAMQGKKCVDVSGALDGADIRLWSCDGGADQRFQLAPTESRGNVLYGAWTSSGGQSATSAGNRSFVVEHRGPARAVTFDLSAPVDTYLYLLDASGNVLAQDDNGGGGTSSRITFTLSSGTYKLVAATFTAGMNAQFALSSDYASLRYPQKLFVKPASRFVWLYDDDGTGADDDVSIWRADLSDHPGYYSLGDVAMPSHSDFPRATFVVKGEGDVLAPPAQYVLTWTDKGSGGDHDVSVWRPVPPAGYTCLGHVAVSGYAMPSPDAIRCVKSAYVLSGAPAKIWDDSGSGADDNVGIWETTPHDYRGLPTSTFVARGSFDDNGGSDLYRVLNKSATANEELRGGAVTGLTAAMFAPRVTLDHAETYFPSSASFFLYNVYEDNGFLTTNENLGGANSTDPVFLDGQRPDQVRVPVYAQIVKRTGVSVDMTDVIYWMFYPYNNGKLVCMGYVTDAGCPTSYKRFGNHVGDWEHMTVRFIDGRPSQVFLAQHSDGDTFSYGQKHLELQGWHAGVYAAKGSHGLYRDAGKHVYEHLDNNDVLVDYTNYGAMWDTWNTVVPFEYQAIGSYTGALDFLNITSRWGNRKEECHVYEVVSGECVLNDGPEAPLVKDFAKPSYTELN
jgi:hypothetical protein